MLKTRFFWIAFFLLMLVPLFITFIFADNLIAMFQDEWNYRPGNYILGDILFYEGGFFLIFGGMVAGAVLFLSWKPDRLGLFVEPVFRWKILKKERDIPAAILLGLLMIIIGISYILACIFVSL